MFTNSVGAVIIQIISVEMLGELKKEALGTRHSWVSGTRATVGSSSLYLSSSGRQQGWTANGLSPLSRIYFVHDAMVVMILLKSWDLLSRTTRCRAPTAPLWAAVRGWPPSHTWTLTHSASGQPSPSRMEGR